jgi:cytosine deaminase
MVEALERGARVVGASPYTDTNPRGQIDRVFQMARTFDLDINMHLDFAIMADSMDFQYVCEQTETYHFGGRVAVGHVMKLSTLSKARIRRIARRMADAGVALTVLPSTDLYLMGRHQDHNVLRGVVAAHELLHDDVNCSLSTNNVLNPSR